MDGRGAIQPGVWTLLTPKWRSALARLRQEQSGSWAKLILFVGRRRALLGRGLRDRLPGAPLLPQRRRDRQSDGRQGAGHHPAGASSRSCCSPTSSPRSRPSSWPRISISWCGAGGLVPAVPGQAERDVVHSSWMVALLALPIFTAYGIVYSGGPLFPLVALAAFVPFLVLPAVLGTIFTLLLVNVFPARRTRELLGLIGLGALVTAVILLRFMRPEQLAQPEGFRNLVDYLAVLRTPTSPLLPSEWTAAMIMNWLLRVADPWPIAELWGAAPGAVTLGAPAAPAALPPRVLQGAGGRRAQGAPAAPRPAGAAAHRLPAGQAGVHPQGPAALLPGQHPVEPAHPAGRPADGLHLQHQVAAAPLGRAGPVQPGHRDLVPEPGPGRVRARRGGGPLHFSRRSRWRAARCGCCARARSIPGAMLWSKYWTGTVPLLVLALVITVFTNWLLQAGVFMMAVSVGTIVLYTLAVSALALSLRRPLSPVRHRERGADPHQLRRAGLHDGQPEPAGRGHHDRGSAGDRTAPGPARVRPLGLTPQLLVTGGAVVVILIGATHPPLRLARSGSSGWRSPRAESNDGRNAAA